MDMDELFSQVDEKRKVSMTIIYLLCDTEKSIIRLLWA